jgi:hypothetical protein
MDIHFEILEVQPDNRSVVVHYFTDDFAGVVCNVTIYPDPMPTGQALVDYILLQAPSDWLVMKSKVARGAPDMSEAVAMRGQRFSKAFEAIRPVRAPAPAIPVVRP